MPPNAVPAWHPAALVTLILLVSATGALLSAPPTAPPMHGTRIGQAYVPLLLVNWGFLLYVCRIGRPRWAFSELAGLRAYTPFTPSRVVRDVALAVVAAAALIGGELAWQLVFGMTRNAAASAMLPQTSLERAVWCAVAVSAGVSEELVYRGYLVAELERWTASPLAAVLGQALLFSLAHGQQGMGAMLRFFAYAAGLGALALARRSLVPGILAHVGVDLVAGLSG